MNDLVKILLLSLLGSVVGLTGGVILLTVKKWSRVLSSYSVPFAAGVLLTVSLLGLLPESVDILGEKGFLVLLLSFLGAYLFEQFFCELHHHDDGHECKKTRHGQAVSLIIAGDTVHNLIDGVAIATAYLVNPGLGLVTAVSTLLHEVPHEIGDFGILLKAGWRKKKIIWVNLISSLTTVVGALLVYYLGIGEMMSGYLLAVAGGMFLYLGASDFLPHAHEDFNKKKALMAMFLGVLAMYGTLLAIPHSH